MREIKVKEIRKHIDPAHLSVDTIIDIGKSLDEAELLHIETVYFTANGDYYFNVHDYTGKEKDYKGKKYARFGKRWITTKQNGLEKHTFQLIPLPEFEIVAEYDAQWIVDEYAKLLKKNK